MNDKWLSTLIRLHLAFLNFCLRARRVFSSVAESPSSRRSSSSLVISTSCVEVCAEVVVVDGDVSGSAPFWARVRGGLEIAAPSLAEVSISCRGNPTPWVSFEVALPPFGLFLVAGLACTLGTGLLVGILIVRSIVN